VNVFLIRRKYAQEVNKAFTPPASQAVKTFLNSAVLKGTHCVCMLQVVDADAAV
jgi:hypothetical protein